MASRDKVNDSNTGHNAMGKVHQLPKDNEKVNRARINVLMNAHLKRRTGAELVLKMKIRSQISSIQRETREIKQFRLFNCSRNVFRQ